jgi:hypothetical protein
MLQRNIFVKNGNVCSNTERHYSFIVLATITEFHSKPITCFIPKKREITSFFNVTTWMKNYK